MKKLKNRYRKSRDPIARDLRTPKYRMRVVSSEKTYQRQKEKQKVREETTHD